MATIVPQLGNLSVHATRFLCDGASSWTPNVCEAIISWVSKSCPSVRELEFVIRALPVAPASCADAVATLLRSIPAQEALKDIVAEYCIVIPTNVKLVNVAVERHVTAEADLLTISIQGAVEHLQRIAELVHSGHPASGLNKHFMVLRTHRRLLDKSANDTTRDTCLVAADAELTDRLIKAIQGIVTADRGENAEMYSKLYREVTMILVTCFWREILDEGLHAIPEVLPLRRLLMYCHLVSGKCSPQLAGRLVLSILLDEITSDNSDEICGAPSVNGGLPLACALACNGSVWHVELVRWSLSQVIPMRIFTAETLLHMGDVNPVFGEQHARLLANLGKSLSGSSVARLAFAFAALASVHPNIISILCNHIDHNGSAFARGVLELLPDHLLSEPGLTSALLSRLEGSEAESLPWLLAILRPRPCDALRRVAPTLLAESRVKSSMRLRSGLGRSLVALSGVSAVVPSATSDRMLRALLIFAEKKLSEAGESEAGVSLRLTHEDLTPSPLQAPWLQLLHILATHSFHQRLEEGKTVIDRLARKADVGSLNPRG